MTSRYLVVSCEQLYSKILKPIIMNKINYLLLTFIFLLATAVSSRGQTSDLAKATFIPRNDSLVVERADGQKITMIWPSRKNIKKNVEWKQLLEDFQTDFRKVVGNIPDYSFYKIQYLQKKNLIVDEIRGRESYAVNESDGMDYIKSNVCSIKGNKIRLTIEFSEVSELLDSSLTQDISTAISEVKHIFYFSMAPERFYYDIENNSMNKNPWPKVKFFIPFGARVGLLKNEPYIELRIGAGLALGKTHYVALNYDIMTRFNELSNRTQYDNYVGLTTGTMGAGFGTEFGIKVKSGIADLEDNFMRAGINYRTRSGIQMGFQYYLRDRASETVSDNIIFGFNLGMGF